MNLKTTEAPVATSDQKKKPRAKPVEWDKHKEWTTQAIIYKVPPCESRVPHLLTCTFVVGPGMAGMAENGEDRACRSVTLWKRPQKHLTV